jgi:outer membrane receptor protein involved in Fe transport
MKLSTVCRLLGYAFAALAVLTHSPPAPAAQPDFQADDSMAEVVVTAQKRAQRAQDVPISVSILSDDMIESVGKRDFADLVLALPGVSSSASQPGLTRYSIRGISTNAANPTVGLYLNDVSLITLSTGFSGAANPMLFDLDRIEVLKGPQGTLYGGSTLGGAIKFVTRKAALNEFSASAAGQVASVTHGGMTYDADTFLNLPLIEDRLAIRLSGAYRSDTGYIDNIPNGQVEVWTRSATLPSQPFAPVTYPSGADFPRSGFNNRTTKGLRLSSLWKPLEGWEVLPLVMVQRSDQSNPDEFFTNLPAFENTARTPQPTRDALNFYSTEISRRRDGTVLTLLAGYVDRKNELDRDFSLFVGLLEPALLYQNSGNATITRSRTWSEELRLASADSSTRLRWATGLFHQEQRDEYDQTVVSLGSGAFYGTGTDIYFTGEQITRAVQIAAFGDLTYALSHHWSISGGVRWFDIRQRIDSDFDGVLNGGHTQIIDRRSVDVGHTSRIAIAYRLDDDRLLYASASQGFRPGGPNRFAAANPLCLPDLERLGLSAAPDSYGPDRLWTYEIGSKNVISGRSVFNAALFFTHWHQIQQQVFLASCAFDFAGNVGAATVKGGEVSLDFPVRLRGRAGGSVTYTASRITESASGVSARVGQPSLDTPRWMIDLHGQFLLATTPRWHTTLEAQYQFHGANLRHFESSMSVVYPDDSIAQISDNTQEQRAYHVANAALVAERSSLQLRVFVDNLFDSAPYLDFRRAPGFSAATTLTPRTIGVAIRARF